MYIKSGILLAGTILARVTLAENAHEIENVSEIGLIDKAYINPETHSILVEDIAQSDSSVIQERSYNTGNTQDKIVKVLKSHNGYGFCKAACPGYSPKPITRTQTKTSTKKIYTTTTIVPNAVTVTLTATAGAPPANVVTSTITQTTTIDITETAQPSTTTSTVSTTSTLTETSTTVTTSILQIPSPTPVDKRRGQSPPSWLRGYASHLICPACNQAWSKPKPKTVIVYKTKVATSTGTITASKPAATNTVIATITPAAGTSTSTSTTVQTLTSTATSTPLETDITTVTSTTTTTSTTTSTVSACAQQTNNVAGIGATSGGHLESSPASSIADCCTACYNSASGCNEWAFLGSGYCFFAVGGSTTGVDGTCPNGRSAGFLLEGGPANLAGGPGPCHS